MEWKYNKQIITKRERKRERSLQACECEYITNEFLDVLAWFVVPFPTVILNADASDKRYISQRKIYVQSGMFISVRAAVSRWECTRVPSKNVLPVRRVVA